MGQHKVEVWGERYDVETYQKSKSVCVASGDYMGQTITVQDRSPGSAVLRWKEAARYRGNG